MEDDENWARRRRGGIDALNFKLFFFYSDLVANQTGLVTYTSLSLRTVSRGSGNLVIYYGRKFRTGKFVAGFADVYRLRGFTVCVYIHTNTWQSSHSKNRT